MTRGNARELAVHLIYGRNFTGEEPKIVVETRLEQEYYSNLSAENDVYAERPSRPQRAYIDTVTSGVANREEDLNEIIQKFSIGWDVKRISRLTRSSLLDVTNREYINGARMKGVNEFTVTLRHALRNSLIPVVTGVSTQLGTILGGAVTVETVFSWPGMGTMLVTAAKQRDFPTVQYGILLVAISVTLVNILVDISYGYLDPRIREDFK